MRNIIKDKSQERRNEAFRDDLVREVEARLTSDKVDWHECGAYVFGEGVYGASLKFIADTYDDALEALGPLGLMDLELCKKGCTTFLPEGYELDRYPEDCRTEVSSILFLAEKFSNQVTVSLKWYSYLLGRPIKVICVLRNHDVKFRLLNPNPRYNGSNKMYLGHKAKWQITGVPDGEQIKWYDGEDGMYPRVTVYSL